MIPPYDHRDFPLTDDVFDALVRMMPDSHNDIIDECIQQQQQQLDTARPSTSNDYGHPNKSEHPETICKTFCDFENFIGASSLSSTMASAYGVPDGGSHMLRDTDEETESVESVTIDEDRNDPDWCEEPPSRL